MNVLFVTNGHGEIAIADCIANELLAVAPEVLVDHFPLVGDAPTSVMRPVGPRASMPSGGLVAMANVTNIARDVRAGLLGLTYRQWRFLRSAPRYDAVVAVGDAFALFMALQKCAQTVYVGTAKSVYVAPYGPVEARLLRRAAAIFVRDEPTAEDLRARGVGAEAPGNVIVDLFARDRDVPANATAGFDSYVAILPGSRAHAYADAEFLVSVFAEVARERAGLGAVLSIAPGLESARFEESLRARGHSVRTVNDRRVPFEVVADDRVLARSWRGGVGPIFRGAALAMGQAGTANEAAAAAGLAVVAFDRGIDREHAWYRRRQSLLLGEALVVASGERASAATTLESLLDDPALRTRLGAIGRARMGAPGGARRIADRITTVAKRVS